MFAANVCRIMVFSVVLVGCGVTPVKTPVKKSACQSADINNICSVIKTNPHWHQAAEKSARRWGTSTPVIMAMIQKESGFRQHARPVKPQKKNSKGRKGKTQYLSSAYGYAQVIDGTWDHYKKQTGRRSARRDCFSDCVHFVGWYNAQSYKKCRIKKNDVYSLYLAYHEGHEGFNKRSHKKKKDIMKYARKVESQARVYEQQLKQCRYNKPLPVVQKKPMQLAQLQKTPESHSVKTLPGKLSYKALPHKLEAKVNQGKQMVQRKIIKKTVMKPVKPQLQDQNIRRVNARMMRALKKHK